MDNAFVRVEQDVDYLSDPDDQNDPPAGEDEMGAVQDYYVRSLKPGGGYYTEDEVLDRFAATAPISLPEEFTVTYFPSSDQLLEEIKALTKAEWEARNDKGHSDMQLAGLGLCPKCWKVIQHDRNEPFAHCDCGTSEWTGRLPVLDEIYMHIQAAMSVLPSRHGAKDHLQRALDVKVEPTPVSEEN